MKYLVFLFLIFPFVSFAQNSTINANTVVNLIKHNINCEWSDKTVDTFKTGDPKTEVSGIVSCMFADMNVLKEAVQLNCNFIITHEPVFYNHLDETSSYKNDPVYIEKRKFIDENKLIIFRFHDHIHQTQPDGIYEGMLNKLGWKNNAIDNSQLLFQFPENTVSSFAKELKKKLAMKTIRIVGDTKMKFTKVGFAVGAPGGQSHIRMLQNPDVEVLVAGEAPEWETYLYTNDAFQQNKNKAVIFLGHIKSEEAGMQYFAKWLQNFVRQVPIHFIENQSNFTEL